MVGGATRENRASTAGATRSSRKPNRFASVTAWVYDLTRYYATEESFTGENVNPGNWYGTRHRLRYTLFEYELHLLATEGQGKAASPDVGATERLYHRTHPPADVRRTNSQLEKRVEPRRLQDDAVHDIANLVLTQNNSNYLAFGFRKKGIPGQSPSYSNSDIRQERKISSFPDWTPTEFKERR